jgi:hypothetical protein
MPFRDPEVPSVQQDDYVVAGRETPSFCGALIYHLHVIVVTIVIGAISLECLALFALQL